ncbi:outer membrane beta-barrel family protein [Parapedobacter pyrenivorans]|uniref:outer membrane beta-barrel family protein n=1 Tax=Parapedobacter pyrenivorans TaxID=1305674 RepID=UPI00333E42D8
MAKIFGLILSLCGAWTVLYGQAIVRGVAVDETGQAIAMATVDVLVLPDSTVATTVATDEQGRFEVQLAPAMYVFTISFVGYQTYTSGATAVVSGTHDMGVLQLEVDEQLLGEVVINRQHRLVEQRSDRLVVNVENSILSDGMTALEILQRAPGVRVDDDGNISMRGKSGVRVLINGKLSYLSAKELAMLLKGTQSSAIKSIELITNPSAKFDAAGNAGLINIVMKTERRSGINGTAHTFAAAGRKQRYGGGLNLNARHNRWNATAGYDYGYRGERENRSVLRAFNHPTDEEASKVSNQYSQTDEPLVTHNAKMGVDYDVNDGLALAARWTGSFGTYDNLSSGYNNIAFGDGRLVSNALTENQHNSGWNTQGASIDMSQKIGERGHELSAEMDYTYADYSADQLLLSDFQRTDFQEAFTSKRRGKTPSITDVWVGKVDYLHRLGRAQKLEAGWKSSWIDADNNALNDTLRNGQWVTDAGTSNHFLYREQIHAGYLNYNMERERWNILIGLRMEHTRTMGHQLTVGERTDRNYTQLFPSFSVSFRPSSERTMQLSYSRRIQRPDYDDLNPFRYYVDAFVFWEGNPYLQPELAHAFELNTVLGGTTSISAYYTYVDDVMTSVLTQLPAQNVTIRSVHNIDGFQNAGLNINNTLKPLPFWTTINNLNGFNNRYRGTFNGETIDNNQWSASFNSINTLSFGNGWDAEVIGEYHTPRVDGVFRLNAYGTIAAGVMKKLVQDRLSLKLAASDLFRTMNYNPRSVADGVVMQQRFDLDSRVVTLSASFRFGQEIKTRDRRAGSEDEQQRIRGGGN